MMGQWKRAMASFRLCYLSEPEGDWAASALLSTLRLEWRGGNEAPALSIYELLAARSGWRESARRAALFLAVSDLVRERGDRAERWLDRAAAGGPRSPTGAAAWPSCATTGRRRSPSIWSCCASAAITRSPRPPWRASASSRSPTRPRSWDTSSPPRAGARILPAPGCCSAPTMPPAAPPRVSSACCSPATAAPPPSWACTSCRPRSGRSGDPRCGVRRSCCSPWAPLAKALPRCASTSRPAIPRSP